MLLFLDRITGDELFTDTFKYSITTEENSYGLGPGLYRVECKMVTEKDSGDYDIGANASAEEASEETEASEKRGLNVALVCKLKEAQIGKADYKKVIKQYMKSLKELLEKEKPEVVETFEANAKKVVGTMIGNKDFAKTYEFYQGESQDPDGMLAICQWEQEETVPVLYFFQEGVRSEKV